MKSKNTLLKLAIAFIGITLLILAYIIIVDALQGHVNWVTLLVALAEGSLLSSLIKMLQDSGKQKRTLINKGFFRLKTKPFGTTVSKFFFLWIIDIIEIIIAMR